MNRGTRWVQTLVGLGLLGSALTGLAGLLGAAIGALIGHPEAAALSLIASGAAFGLLANALLRN